MSRKSRKPKAQEAKVFSAENMANYLRIKFDVDDNGFWDWFFSECPWGETNFLSLDDNDIDIIANKFKSYYNLIKTEFLPDADEQASIQIKNDL